MKTLVMDGFHCDGDIQERVVGAVTAELSERGWEWDILAPRDMKIGPCSGCFGCWIKRPGMCVQVDDIHLLCSKIVASELFLIVSPISFGGYSSETKKAMDRIIGLISPFFSAYDDEVHHRPRYDRFPAMAVLGINHDKCERCPEIFRTLLYRNAINLHTPALAVAVVGGEDLSDNRNDSKRVVELLDQARSSVFSELPERRVRREEFDVAPGTAPLVDLEQREEKRALLLIGSPKVHSTSSSIGDELATSLRSRGWQAETKRILPAVRDEAKWQALTEVFDSANLIVLISPLYVDSLPAPVTRALELLAVGGKGRPGGKGRGFLAVMNNGFPEAVHSHTALGIARQFAVETGHEWLGGLALGMGGAIDGKPLAKKGRMVRNVSEALDLSAAALDRGQPVPAEAVDLMARPLMPTWLYTAVGNRGWKRQAKQNGVREKMMARPYSSVPA